MRKTTDQDRRDVFTEWLGGASYREISEKFDLSLGSISRIIDENRKTSADIDRLRGLCVRLKESGFTSSDAVRACRLLEWLNSHGIGLGELRQYVETCQRILSDRNLQDSLMAYAVRLMHLEEKCQKPFEKVVEDFDRTVSEAARTKAENAQLKRRNRELEKEAENTTRNIKKLDAEHAQVSGGLEKLLAARKLLQSVGLRKLLTLAKFNQDFETLGFSIEETRKLSILKRDLIDMGMNPENLKEDISRVQSLGGQVTGLRREVESLENRRQHLLQAQPALLAADAILQRNTIIVPCKACGNPLHIPLPTRQQYSDMVSRGMFFPTTCTRCGYQHSFSMLEIATQVAWILLR